MANDIQARFNVARDSYAKVESILRDMTEKVVSFESDFRHDWAMLQYDLILQSVLLAQAIADGKYLAIENSFIRQITDYGDITLAFNQKASDENLGLEELDWDGLAELIISADDERRVKLVTIFTSIAWDYSNTLIGFFAPVDAVIERDFLKEIVDATVIILFAFTEIDGDSVEQRHEAGSDADRELTIAVSMLENLLVKRWKQKIAEFEAWRRRNNPDAE